MKTEILFQKGLQALGLSGSDAIVCQLGLYYNELIKWNRAINLVGKAGAEEIIDNHFLDSLTLLPLLSGATNLMDVGTGAGFPGLVLKIARPELDVTLVEPRQKRVAFLNHIARKLSLEKLDIRNSRLESKNIDQTLAGRFQAITSRAFTSIGDFLALSAPYNVPGGKVLCMKGPGATKEIAEWRQSQPQSPYSLMKIHTLQLPFSGKERNLLEFRLN